MKEYFFCAFFLGTYPYFSVFKNDCRGSYQPLGQLNIYINIHIIYIYVHILYNIYMYILYNIYMYYSEFLEVWKCHVIPVDI